MRSIIYQHFYRRLSLRPSAEELEQRNILRCKCKRDRCGRALACVGSEGDCRRETGGHAIAFSHRAVGEEMLARTVALFRGLLLGRVAAASTGNRICSNSCDKKRRVFRAFPKQSSLNHQSRHNSRRLPFPFPTNRLI